MRWYNRYWYFVEVPERLFVESSPYWSFEAQKDILEKCGKIEKTPTALKEDYVFPEKSSGQIISFYSTQNEIDQLLEALDENGIREKKLIHSIRDLYPKMTPHMNRLQNDSLKEILSDGNVRRSNRIKSTEKVFSPDISFLTYVNKYSRS